jgi:hypothetical protein
MFRNVNEFFERVYNCEVTSVDIHNFVYIVTDDKPYQLFLLKKDLMFFILRKENELFGKITQEDINKKLDYYSKKGVEPPKRKWINHISKKLNERNGNKELTEGDETLDLEKMFFPHEFFCIRSLEKYIESLINKDEHENKTQTPKHDNIFSNNGFVLFEHLLENYIKPKGKKGRLSDIGFYYRKMFECEPQYIHQNQETFKKWFYSNYNYEEIGKIKPLYELKNPDREKHYSTALEWFKSQNK